MHTLLPYLVAALLGVHALLGCGWRHALDCLRCEASITDPSELAACCQHCHDEDQHQQPEPRKCQLDCCGVCTYLPPERTQIESPTVVIPFDYAVVMPSPMTGDTVAIKLLDLASGLAKLEPPLRLHLMHQILLI